MSRKKIYTEEELKERHRIACRKRYQNNKEKIKEREKEYYLNNKEKIKEQRKEYKKQWRENNKEKIKECNKKYYKDNKEKVEENLKKYKRTFKGRASYLLASYKRLDRENNRGQCTLTQGWIVDNIFSNSCVYCGESDWNLLGCDRKDNTLPHTKDNCVPCCRLCNIKKKTKSYEEYMKLIGKDVS